MGGLAITISRDASRSAGSTADEAASTTSRRSALVRARGANATSRNEARRSAPSAACTSALASSACAGGESDETAKNAPSPRQLMRGSASSSGLLPMRAGFGACAAAALYRRTVFDGVGLFDEDFFAYCEDGDLSFRAQLAGYRCLYAPQAVVYHVGSVSTGGKRRLGRPEPSTIDAMWTCSRSTAPA